MQQTQITRRLWLKKTTIQLIYFMKPLQNNKVLKSSLVDTVVMVVLMLPLFIAAYWTFAHYDNDTHQVAVFISANVDLILVRLIFGYLVLIMSWLVLKDCLKMSPGKRLFKVKVVDKRTRKEARCVMKMGRNIFLLLFFPVEVVLKISTPKSRLGDMLANTVLESD